MPASGVSTSDTVLTDADFEAWICDVLLPSVDDDLEKITPHRGQPVSDFEAHWPAGPWQVNIRPFRRCKYLLLMVLPEDDALRDNIFFQLSSRYRRRCESRPDGTILIKRRRW